MVRALDCGSSCWGFESPQSPQKIKKAVSEKKQPFFLKLPRRSTIFCSSRLLPEF